MQVSRALFTSLLLFQLTASSPTSSIPSSLQERSDTPQTTRENTFNISLGSNNRAVYEVSFELNIDRPLKSDLLYQTLGLAFEVAYAESDSHRGVWDFPSPFGVRLHIQPIVVPWMDRFELSSILEGIALAQVNARGLGQADFAEGQGVLYKDRLAFASITVSSSDTSRIVIKRDAQIISPEAKPTIDTDPNGPVLPMERDPPPSDDPNTLTTQSNEYKIRTRLGNVLDQATEDDIMLTLIHSLQLCINEPNVFLPSFQYHSPTRLIQVMLRPEASSLVQGMIVATLSAIIRREYEIKDWQLGGRWRELDVWVALNDQQVAWGGLRFWPT